MITATIKNVIKDLDRIRVFVDFSDGTEQAFIFLPDVNRIDIRQAIKAQLEVKNALEHKVETYQDLIGVVLS